MQATALPVNRISPLSLRTPVSKNPAPQRHYFIVSEQDEFGEWFQREIHSNEEDAKRRSGPECRVERVVFRPNYDAKYRFRIASASWMSRLHVGYSIEQIEGAAQSLKRPGSLVDLPPCMSAKEDFYYEEETFTRAQGLARVAELNRRLLKEEGFQGAIDYGWSVLVEIGESLPLPVCKTRIEWGSNGIGAETRTWVWSVRLVKPTPAERAKYSI